MGIHYEWMQADVTSAAFLPAGYDVYTGRPATGRTRGEHFVGGEHFVEWECGGALVLSGDDVMVLTGTPDELRQLAHRINQALADTGDPDIGDPDTASARSTSP